MLFNPFFSKISPSINWTDVIRNITNTQAINIGKRKVIGRYRLFTFQAWQKYIQLHIHGRCNILCDGEWMLCLCMDYLIYEYFLQIISLNSLQMWWEYIPLCLCVFYILYIQFDISIDIGSVYISINIIIIIIIVIIKININEII